jgi:hypothetical protein
MIKSTILRHFDLERQILSCNSLPYDIFDLLVVLNSEIFKLRTKQKIKVLDELLIV